MGTLTLTITITIPNTITFTPATEYQLWLQSKNAKGLSEPGPITEWVATQAGLLILFL